MRLNEEKVQRIIEVLQENSLNVRSYSGRGMYGKQCVGVDTDERGTQMAIAICLIGAGVDSDDVFSMAEDTHTDSMGLGQIIYWPWVLQLNDAQVEALNEREYAGEEEGR